MDQINPQTFLLQTTFKNGGVTLQPSSVSGIGYQIDNLFDPDPSWQLYR